MEAKERHCTKCGKIAAEGRHQCEACLEAARQYMRARKERLVAEGKCVRCGREPHVGPGKCDVCRGRRARTTHLDTSRTHDR